MSKSEGPNGKAAVTFIQRLRRTQGRCEQNPKRENQKEIGRKHKQKIEKGQPKGDVMEERRRLGERVEIHGEDTLPEWGTGTRQGVRPH